MATKTTIVNSADLELKISTAVTLLRWLNSQPLQGQMSRRRTQFATLLNQATTQADKKRIELLTQFADKDENGKPKTFIDGENNEEKFDITEENEKKYVELFNEFLSQSFVLHFDIDQVNLYQTIKELVLGTDYKFSGQMANEFELWCQAFEK